MWLQRLRYNETSLKKHGFWLSSVSKALKMVKALSREKQKPLGSIWWCDHAETLNVSNYPDTSFKNFRTVNVHYFLFKPQQAWKIVSSSLQNISFLLVFRVNNGHSVIFSSWFPQLILLVPCLIHAWLRWRKTSFQ